MEDGMIMLTFDEDGKAEIYDDEFDITIHCTSQEDHDEVLKILRSANWIPCSERLPKPSEHTDNMVLVCMSDGKVRFGACWYNRGICEGWVGDLPVVAWRPLPEPWKGEER